MIKTLRTDPTHPHFISLVKLLDAELAERDGEDHAFYARFNKIDAIKHVVLVYEDEQPVGCGGMKTFEGNAVEIKRMFVLPESRGRGTGSLVLAELEKWARELGYSKCVLETGKRQPEAIRLYRKNGYRPIPNYGQYANDENSLCFEKTLNLKQI